MKKVLTASRIGKPLRGVRREAAESDALVSVASFFQAAEAHLLCAHLESEGIPCELSSEYFALVDLPVAQSSGGIQVLVRASDAPRSQEIIQALT
ncbi:MAG: DUF2007 domain-containing protein [Armatimonadota bacterium]|nr:DUF2007 domain-containing protein [Armatimonadota bacterium]